MPWSGSIATTEFLPEGRYRPQGRRAPPSRSPKAEELGASKAPGEPLDAAGYAGRFTSDLTQLQTFGAAGGNPDGESDRQLFDFFGNLGELLLAVRAGDIGRAQAAADALEMEALVGRSAGRRPGAAGQMLDDLGALFTAAPSRDQSAARLAARQLAANFDRADAPDPQPDDGGAAYDTLMQYLGVG